MDVSTEYGVRVSRICANTWLQAMEPRQRTTLSGEVSLAYELGEVTCSIKPNDSLVERLPLIWGQTWRRRDPLGMSIVFQEAIFGSGYRHGCSFTNLTCLVPRGLEGIPSSIDDRRLLAWKELEAAPRSITRTLGTGLQSTNFLASRQLV